MKPMQRKQSGQSLVELAISLMIILMLLLGAVEISLALFQYVTIRDAAQEGALYASTNPSDESGIKFRAIAAADDMVNIPAGNIEVILNGSAYCEGLTDGVANSITVRITFAHPVAFPLVGPMIGSNTINLTANVTNAILSPQC